MLYAPCVQNGREPSWLFKPVRLHGHGCGCGCAAWPSRCSAQADDIGATARAKQWSLAPLGVAEAWQRTRGEDVVVAVLDTGVDGPPPRPGRGGDRMAPT